MARNEDSDNADHDISNTSYLFGTYHVPYVSNVLIFYSHW